MGATRFEIPEWESIGLLREETIGRLCVNEHGYPLAFPVNYRFVRVDGVNRVVVRTGPLSALARCEGLASFEVDHIDAAQTAAWSVIVRGNLRRAASTAVLPDTEPFVSDGKQQWVVLDVASISGRRFTKRDGGDGFSVEWQPIQP